MRTIISVKIIRLLKWNKVGPLKYLEESGILLVRVLLLGLEKIKLVSLRDVLDLELEKLECLEIIRSLRSTWN